jgi:putative SOS response-associated peptidase YedK
MSISAIASAGARPVLGPKAILAQLMRHAMPTDANELAAKVHDRMPVILLPEEYDQWLDPEFQNRDKLLSMLRPFPADEMTVRPVSTFVNNARN